MRSTLRAVPENSPLRPQHDDGGTQNGSEPGIAGVTVNLLDNDGNAVGTTTSDENGLYSFPDVPGGEQKFSKGKTPREFSRSRIANRPHSRSH